MKVRLNVRPDFSVEAWNRTPAEIAAKAAAGALPPGWLMNGQPTTDVVGPNEIPVTCPQCGTGHIVTFEADDPTHGDTVQVTLTDPRLFSSEARVKSKTLTIDEAIPGFSCKGGDCGYAGHAGRA